MRLKFSYKTLDEALQAKGNNKYYNNLRETNPRSFGNHTRKALSGVYRESEDYLKLAIELAQLTAMDVLAARDLEGASSLDTIDYMCGNIKFLFKCLTGESKFVEGYWGYRQLGERAETIGNGVTKDFKFYRDEAERLFKKYEGLKQKSSPKLGEMSSH
jgi:hypothetical protein